ncbi:uncharacterized protein CBL_09451 [Carabus blaptoides fortunei]
MMDENTTVSEIPNEDKDVTVVTSEEFLKNAPPMVKEDELPLEKDRNEETKDVEQTTEQVHLEPTEENVDKIEEIEQEGILSVTDKKSEEDEKVLQHEENITARDSEFESARSSILEHVNHEYEYNEEDEIQKLKFAEMEYAYEEMEEEFEDEFEMDYLREVGKEIEDIYLQPFYKRGTQDDISEKDFNIFGEPRASQLGPVVSFSSGSGEEEELLDHDSFYKMNLMETDIAGYAIRADKIDRDIYMEEYNKLVTQRGNLRRKNGYLNKKIAEYYFKRKMERVFDEITSDYEDILLRYERKIDEMYEFRDQAQIGKDIVKKEIVVLYKERNQLKLELNKILSDMLNREIDVGTKLFDMNTGQIASSKLIEKLVQRQKLKIEQIGKIRFNYIRRKEKNKEVEKKVKALETIGGTLHLMDFEQIRMDNQMTSDKVEEREAELLKLRNRYSNDVMAIAHTREKTAVVENQIADLKEEYLSIEQKLNEIREEINTLSTHRDANRKQTKKLKEESGLLPYTNLLIDFEDCINRADKYKQEINDLKNLYKLTRRKIAGIKHTIENMEQVYEDSLLGTPVVTKKRTNFYRNRPKLAYPVLPKISHTQQSVEM